MCAITRTLSCYSAALSKLNLIFVANLACAWVGLLVWQNKMPVVSKAQLLESSARITRLTIDFCIG